MSQIAQTITSNYSVTAADNGVLLVVSSDSTVTVTLPHDIAVSRASFFVDVTNMGSGAVVVSDPSSTAKTFSPPAPGYTYRYSPSKNRAFPPNWAFDVFFKSAAIPPDGAEGKPLTKTGTRDYEVGWADSSGGGGTWGSITGTLSDQTDLQAALDGLASEIGAAGTNVPPPTTGWSWVNQGTSTVTSTAGLFFNMAATGTDYMRGYVRSKTGNFTLTIGVLMRPLGGGFGSGIVLSDGTKYITFNWMDFTMSSNGYSLRLQKWNNPTSYNSLYSSIDGASFNWLTGTIWYRLVADSTNFTWYYSFDKANWIQFDQQPRTDFLGTLSQIGIGGHTITAGMVSLVSWEEA